MKYLAAVFAALLSYLLLSSLLFYRPLIALALLAAVTILATRFTHFSVALVFSAVLGFILDLHSGIVGPMTAAFASIMFLHRWLHNSFFSRASLLSYCVLACTASVTLIIASLSSHLYIFGFSADLWRALGLRSLTVFAMMSLYIVIVTYPGMLLLRNRHER